MKTIIDKANTRGYFNHGWLKTGQRIFRVGKLSFKRIA